MVAGTHSGAGKTTVATGLMAALSRRGVAVAPAKVGPDYIDPGYHAVATGRPGRNLDAWMCGEDAVAPLAAAAASGADVLVVEGVMGLFDGASDGRGHAAAASTAHVARLLGAPVLLVVDASAMAGSVAAVVHGFRSLDPSVAVAGVVLNRVASDGHEALLREALDRIGAPVLGALRRDDALAWRDRHLGLVPVAEGRAGVAAALDRLASSVERHVDLGAVAALARSAPAAAAGDPPSCRPVAPGARVAMASGPAFSFTYPETAELLEQAGAEVVPFDPLADRALPDGVTGLYAGGGFPEVYAERLAANASLLADVARRVVAGLPTWAECGGLLWLCRSLDGHRLAGVVPADARMTGRLTLGYREATALADTPLAPSGGRLRGHEFHYSATDPAGDALDLQGRFGRGPGGFATPTMIASYLHVHPSAHPEAVERFAGAARPAQ